MTSSSTELVRTQIGYASMPANSLKSIALPSMTGIAASGPMLPRPSTAVPSVRTATELPLIVYFLASETSAAIALLTRPTPGVYAIDRSSRVRSGNFGSTVILPPRCRANVRSSALTTVTPATDPAAATTSRPCASLRQCTVMSRTTTSSRCPLRSTESMLPPAAPMAVVNRPSAPGAFSSSTVTVKVYAGVVTGFLFVAAARRPR